MATRFLALRSQSGLSPSLAHFKALKSKDRRCCAVSLLVSILSPGASPLAGTWRAVSGPSAKARLSTVIASISTTVTEIVDFIKIRAETVGRESRVAALWLMILIAPIYTDLIEIEDTSLQPSKHMWAVEPG